MTRKPCERCGWPAARHDTMPTDDCPSYVAPAPLWMRLLNRALTALNRRIG